MPTYPSSWGCTHILIGRCCSLIHHCSLRWMPALGLLFVGRTWNNRPRPMTGAVIACGWSFCLFLRDVCIELAHFLQQRHLFQKSEQKGLWRHWRIIENKSQCWQCILYNKILKMHLEVQFQRAKHIWASWFNCQVSDPKSLIMTALLSDGVVWRSTAWEVWLNQAARACLNVIVLKHKVWLWCSGGWEDMWYEVKGEIWEGRP